MPTHPDRVAWRRATTSTLLNIAGMPIELAIGWSVPDMPRWPPLLSIAVSSGLLAWLLIKRATPTRALAATAFTANNACIVVALWVTAGYHAAGPTNWTPFEANKLGCLAVALLAPEPAWVGLANVGLFAGSAIAKLYLVPGLPPGYSVQREVLPILAFALFGAALLIHRYRLERIQREMAQAQARTLMAQAIAQRLVAISDLVNSPLQTLELNAALLQHEHEREPVARMQRAIAKLRTWHLLLEEQARQLPWSPETESFDARTVLETNGASDRSPRAT